MTTSIDIITPNFSLIAPDAKTHISAKALHEFLGVRRDFSNWLKARVEKYKFSLGIHFFRSPDLANRVSKNAGILMAVGNLDSPNLANQDSMHGGDRRSTNYILTINMAKQLAMVENNDMGLAARDYFIQCEERLHAIVENPIINLAIKLRAAGFEGRTLIGLCKTGLLPSALQPPPPVQPAPDNGIETLLTTFITELAVQSPGAKTTIRIIRDLFAAWLHSQGIETALSVQAMGKALNAINVPITKTPQGIPIVRGYTFSA